MLGAAAIGSGLYRHVLCAIADTLRAGASTDRAWHRDRLRPVDRRHHALVRAAARHRRRHLLIRQLSRRRVVAADHTAVHRQRRLARNAPWHRDFLPCDAAAAVAATRAPTQVRTCQAPMPRRGRRLRHFAANVANPAVDCRRCLLCRDVDAAGASRRLLQRSRLWRRAWRRHARVDDGVRHCQPHRLGLHRRPGRRPAHACCSALSCRVLRCCSTHSSTD